MSYRVPNIQDIWLAEIWGLLWLNRFTSGGRRRSKSVIWRHCRRCGGLNEWGWNGWTGRGLVYVNILLHGILLSSFQNIAFLLFKLFFNVFDVILKQIFLDFRNLVTQLDNSISKCFAFIIILIFHLLKAGFNSFGKFSESILRIPLKALNLLRHTVGLLGNYL